MKKNNQIMLAVNGIIMAAIFVLNYFYQSNGFDFTLKCVCSSGFALLGLINLGRALAARQPDAKFHVAMAAGLVLALLGDILIGYHFIAGAGAFALGHICFIIAYCFLQKLHGIDLAVSAVIFLGAAAFLLFCPLLRFEAPGLRMVCIVYALIISSMLGKAVGNLIREKNALYAVIAAASFLFFFSDLMLVLDWFIGLWDWTSEACMGTYYPALCMLAFSMCLKTNQYRKSAAYSD